MKRALLPKDARPGLLLAAVLLAVLCAFTAVACGASGESQAGKGKAAPSKEPTALDLVRLSQKKTAKAQSARFSMTVSFPAPVAGGRMSLASSGAEDFANQKAAFVMRLPAMAGGLDEFEARTVGTKIYEKFPQQLLAQLPGIPPGTNWVVTDLNEQYQKQYGVNFSDLQSAGASDPEGQLKYLSSVGSVKKVGQEKVRGVQTTHYRAVIDLSKDPAARKDPKLQKAYAKMKKQLGTNKLPLEVWLDKEGRVRRQTMSFPMPDTAKVSGQSTTQKLPDGKINIAIEFYDFGVPVRVSPPPADQTISMEKFQQAAQKAA